MMKPRAPVNPMVWSGGSPFSPTAPKGIGGIEYTDWAGIYAFFFSILTYTSVYLVLIQRSFTLITYLPDKVLRWIGGSPESIGGESTQWGDEVKSKQQEGGKETQTAGGQMNKTLGGYGGKAVGKMAGGASKADGSGEYGGEGQGKKGGGQGGGKGGGHSDGGDSSPDLGDSGGGGSGGGGGSSGGSAAPKKGGPVGGGGAVGGAAGGGGGGPPGIK
jgi:defect-in-organelle-trafficking protein DotA